MKFSRKYLQNFSSFVAAIVFVLTLVSTSNAQDKNATLDAGILIYSRSKGVFVGATIGGAVLTADNSINEAFYKMKAFEVLEKPESINMTSIAKDLRDFSNTVKIFAK